MTTKDILSLFILLYLVLPSFGAAVSPNSIPKLHDDLPLLTSVRSVRMLSVEEAARGYPVRLQAVVTFHNNSKDCFILQGDEGLYLARSGAAFNLSPGNEVEIWGITAPGDFAPIMLEKEVRVLADGTLPKAREASFDDLSTGAEDCRFVEVRGVLCSVRPAQQNHLRMTLAMGGGRLEVYVFDFPIEEAKRLIDSTLRLRGAVGCSFNQNRQLIAPRLFVAGRTNIVVEALSPEDPFNGPPRAVRSLLQFRPNESVGHRIKVQGVLTYQQLGQAVFIRDGTNGLYAQTDEVIPLQAGDIVEVLGFPQVGLYSPYLRDATYRRISQGLPPLPVENGARNFQTGAHDADLITVRASLLDAVCRNDAILLTLQSDGVIFSAVLEESPESLEGKLEKNSELGLTGICQVDDISEMASSVVPRSFRLLLRSPNDIVLVKRPSWWTAERLLWVLALMASLVLGALLWIQLLGRRVRRQTEIIRQTIQREAVLEERHRIAREFHDTLEQELAGLSIQLDAVASRNPQLAGTSLLANSRKLVQRIQTNARYAIMDLRCRRLLERDLAAALGETTQHIWNATSVNVGIHVNGEPRPLPLLMDHHLLRIGQEAISNAMKHAQCRSIQVTLQYNSDRLHMRVADDGRGFEIGNGRFAGHFGLMGMKERAKKMGATFSIQSTPGEGTEISVDVPITGTDRAANLLSARNGHLSESESKNEPGYEQSRYDPVNGG